MAYLDLTDVKRMAWEEGLKEIYFNWTSRVVSFSSGDARINVYWTTGTVGVCVYPEQTFHYRCSLFDLQNLMRDPRLRNGRGYSEADECGSEEAELAKEKQRQAHLQAELNRRKAEEKRRKAEAKARRREALQRQRRIEEKRQNRGSLIAWTDCLNQGGLLNGLNCTTKCIAISGDAVFLLNEDGHPWWTSGIPTLLYNKVNGRQKSLPRPTYVAMGSYNRYYIRFKDGKSEWVGDLPLQDVQGKPKIVCFGEDEDSYFILMKDGRKFWNNIPVTVHNKINSRNPRLPGLEFISLGPDGEWFLRWANGVIEWNGVDWIGNFSTAREFYFGNYGAGIVRYN